MKKVSLVVLLSMLSLPVLADEPIVGVMDSSNILVLISLIVIALVVLLYIRSKKKKK